MYFDRPDKDDQNMLKIYQYNLLNLLRFLTIKTVVEEDNEFEWLEEYTGKLFI
jgi:hypothetical protein